jgi:hypothetical protein
MQAHNKRGKKAKWNNVARGLKGNKKSFYKYIQGKEQNREKNTEKWKCWPGRLKKWPKALSYLLFFSVVNKIWEKNEYEMK